MFIQYISEMRKCDMKPSSSLSIHHPGQLWLPNMAPRQGMALCMFIVLVLTMAAIHMVRHQPSAGIAWEAPTDGEGLLVRRTTASASIPQGTRIVGLKSAGRPILPLHSGMLVEDPDQYAFYSLYNAFFFEQRELMERYTEGMVFLIDPNGTSWPLSTTRKRPLRELPASFWVLNMTAAVGFMVGCGIWCYRRGTAAGRLLATTGLCYFLSIICLSIYGSRELVMDPVWFRSLSAANHLFTLTWCYSLLLMIALYPSPMGGRLTIVTVYVLVLVIWLNQTLQWIEIPVHAYYGLTHLAAYLCSIVLAAMQWRRTARNPVERASLRWFILSIFITIGMAAVLFVLPAVSRNYGAVPLWLPAISVLLMFVGFSFGILRYGLFNLERWWFLGWVWLISGLLITGIDGLLILLLHLSFQTLLPYSILLLGWIYFPLRHWLWHRLVKPETYWLEHHLPVLIRSLLESGTMQSFSDRWSEFLRQVYNPLEIDIHAQAGNSVTISRHGLEIEIPGIDGHHTFRLIGNRQGTRLFGRMDTDLAEGLLSLSQAIFTLTRRTHDVQQKGAAEERARIMRDLHDDVLPKLITIKQQAPTPAITKLAESAFQSIRETIYILCCPTDQPLGEALADWRAELAERLSSTNLEMVWNITKDMDGHHLTARQVVNCERILREAVSNILQHAGASKITVDFRVTDDRLHLTVMDNGKWDEASVQNGLGMRNMRLRATAMNGTIAWIPNFPGVMVALVFPIRSARRKSADVPIDEAAADKCRGSDSVRKMS
jgi:signal transduction histidine kinase